MKNTFIASIIALSATGAASAQAVNGSVGAEISQSSGGDFVTEATIGFGASTEFSLGTAFGGFDFKSEDGGELTLDQWQIGVATTGATISFGDQGSIFVENDFNIVGGTTLAYPDADRESLIVDFGPAAVLVGFADISNDVTDIENTQVAYTTDFAKGTVTGVVDYNFNTESYTLGGQIDYSVTAEVTAGAILTYESAEDLFAYEATASYAFATAFLNGDSTDWAQNVGVGVTHNLNGMDLYAEASYNLDDQSTEIGAGVMLKF
jgi:hypothetical protein